MHDVLIIGAGPAGLFAAEHLSAAGLGVTIIDRMPSPARKFLMAGRGGLNITHSEPLETFLGRYREAEPFLQPMISAFPPSALVEWCNGLGEETFVGTSGRVFPKAMKASPLLRAWLRRLDQQGVKLLPRRTFCGFNSEGLPHIQEDNSVPRAFPARAVLLALGGASWPKLGSNAAWVPSLRENDIEVHDFQPANCGFQVAWCDFIKDRFAGHPLKRIRISCGKASVLGEAVLSDKGLEGGAIYALSAEIRSRLNQQETAEIAIDLRPQLSTVKLTEKLKRPKGKQSISTFLKKAVGLRAAELSLLREAGALPASPEDLAQRIKAVPILCQAPYSIDRAISSAGGIALSEVDANLMLKQQPGIFAAGEMLDWEAPTGGYLLQACFATGLAAAKGIRAYLTTQTNESPSL
ncbi:TIGR03862 family flavoprotein [Labrenzia sp. PHM005]|uniref:TIGR03862 family flavoprotein n=1 Tax=Labrenzia sp. PHM005 TaxID=2590016 RepID=UPI0011405870|nr:TIGR03862 family flavoprotein [Labrenzia sp. PHM005]QDG79278.1 TIGR03862 family flavoprotein [Labrenzia sp. PHM005]